MKSKHRQTCYFIYDGQCPLCATAARLYRIQKAVGELQMIDARCECENPILKDILNKGFDLDRGMVIYWNRRYYQGSDALVIMALLSSKHGWYNRIHATLFRSPWIAKLLYPGLRFSRTVLLKLKGVQPFKAQLS